jgi:hypothetical protein
MTLQDWGAIGELVGGVAVIVTLVYLGLQIRQYALGMSSATFHSSMQGFNQINAMLAMDPDLAKTLERGMRDPALLDDREKYQFVWLIRCYVNIYENLYQQFLRAACPEEYWSRYAREIKQTLDSAGGREFRESNTTYVELYAYVDAMPDDDRASWDFTLRSEPAEESTSSA